MITDIEQLQLWHRTKFLPKCYDCKKYLLFPYNENELTCLNCGRTFKFPRSDFVERVYNRVKDLIEKHDAMIGGEKANEEKENQKRQEEKEESEEKVNA